MNIGVSTGCFFPEKTDTAFEMVAETGAKTAEIFFNTDSELDEHFVNKLKKTAEENNIKVISVHPFTSAIETFMFFSRTDYKLEDSVKYYEKYFKACNILGAEYVVIHGCNIMADYMDMKRYADNLNALSRKAREYGVYISQENVVKFKCGYAENLRKFIRYADKDIKFVFDFKQSIRADQDMYEIIDIMGNRISHLHVSDYDGKTESLLPGQGSVDFCKLFDYVHSRYNVNNAIIEVYNENMKGICGLSDAIAYLDKYNI